jgi:hypothetical protein
VRYVLEGSVLADATRVRVNAQLVEAQTDEHLWAERFDKERRDILQVQDEIVARLSRTVGVEMVRNDGAQLLPRAAGVGRPINPQQVAWPPNGPQIVLTCDRPTEQLSPHLQPGRHRAP